MRLALILSVIASIVALGLSAGAFVLALDDDGEAPGRVLELNPGDYQTSMPVLFERDDFYLVKLDGQTPEGTRYTEWRALYRVVPHLVFGLKNGCRVVWQPDRVFETAQGSVTGVFYEGCGGSVFSIRGDRLFGPAATGLPQFLVYQAPNQTRVTVDTRVMICEQNWLPYCRRTLDDSAD